MRTIAAAATTASESTSATITLYSTFQELARRLPEVSVVLMLTAPSGTESTTASALRAAEATCPLDTPAAVNCMAPSIIDVGVVNELELVTIAGSVVELDELVVVGAIVVVPPTMNDDRIWRLCSPYRTAW